MSFGGPGYGGALASGRGVQTGADRPLLRPRRSLVILTAAALSAYAAVQALIAHAVVTTDWWSRNLAYERLHLRQTSPLPVAPVPGPGWQAWVPSVVTSVVLVAALTLLALLVAAAGHGAWVPALAVLPLVPVLVAPDTWAPPLTNPVTEPLLWPTDGSAPTMAWAWVAAGLAAATVLVPGMSLPGLLRFRRPRVDGRAVLWRFAPAALAVALVVAWQVHADRTVEPRTVAWQGGLALAAALVVGGRRVRWWTVPAVLALAAVAGGVVEWQVAGGPPGSPSSVVTDQKALWLSAGAAAGMVWLLAEPVLARWSRRGVGAWWGLVRLQAEVRAEAAVVRAQEAEVRAEERAQAKAAAQVAARAAAKQERATKRRAEQERAEQERAELERAEQERAALSRGPAPAAPVPAGGRHRA
jgi:hypothetical protein